MCLEMWKTGRGGRAKECSTQLLKMGRIEKKNIKKKTEVGCHGETRCYGFGIVSGDGMDIVVKGG